MTNVKNAIRKLAGATLVQTYLCKVVKVEGDRCECEPVQGGANFLDVRLRSILDDNTDGLLLIPKKNSLVIIGIIENNDSAAFVLQFSEIDELKFKNAGGMTVDVLKDVIKLNGDGHAGIPKVKKVKDVLNDHENKINAILQALQGVIIPLAPSGTYPFAPLFSSIQPLINTQQSDIENTKVKHG